MNAQSFDQFKKRELDLLFQTCSFPISCVDLYKYFKYDPYKIRKALYDAIENALGLAANGKPKDKKSHFVVWNLLTDWPDYNNCYNQVVSTLLSSSSHALEFPSFDLFDKSFAGIPGYMGIQGGLDPIIEGANPLYWYHAGDWDNFQLIDLNARIQLYEMLSATFEKKRNNVFEFITVPNPYLKVISQLQHRNGIAP